MSREALVVGINRYPFMDDRDLGRAVADAVAIAKMLKDHGGFHVRLVLAAAPADGSPPVDRSLISDIKLDRKGLEEAIGRLFNPSEIPGEGNDTALLFFAGHGFVKDPDGVREGFLATSDADGEYIWGVSFNWLRQELLTSKVRQKLVWLDCCHSGELFNAYGDLKGSPGSMCLIAACRSFELASEGSEHGVLTGALLEALDPNNQHHQNNWVTNYDLVDYIDKLTTTPQAPVTHNFKGEIVITGPKDIIDQAKLQEKYCPYKGLESFEFDDSEYFYGRTALIEQMLDRLSASNFLAVLGASGSGKSSVVKAGLLRKWPERMGLSGSDACKFVIFRPGEHPLQSLVRAFGVPDEYDLSSVDLAQLVRDAAAQSVVLVADQFEEIFTLCQDIPSRERFLACLLGALEACGESLHAIVTMRADFLGSCVEREYSGLNKKIQDNLILVTPMNQAELREAIAKPADKVGLHVQEVLIEQILKDVEGQPGILPLLQYTLRELWQNRLVHRWTLEEYAKMGGVTRALQKRADEVYESLNEEQQSAAKWIFQNLTQISEDSSDTRKQALKRDLIGDQYPQEIIDETLDKLVAGRLLVTSEKGGETTVDVAHEALIRHWKLLRDWVESEREALKFKHKIELDAQEWLDKGKSDALLLSPGKLEEASRALKQYEEWGLLSTLVKEYIEESRQLQKERVTLPQMRADAAVAHNLLNANPVYSLALAIKAAGDNLGLEKYRERDEGLEHYVQSSLRNAITKVRETNRFSGHENSVWSVAFSPDGKRIVSGSKDNTIGLWDLEGNPIGEPFRGHENSVWLVAFSPDGKRIVSGSSDNTIRLWDLEGNPIGEPFRGHENEVLSVAFSPNGKRIVSGSSDNTIGLWDLEGNQIVEHFRGHENSVWSVAFSPDGTRIVSGSDDNTIGLWDLEGNQIGEPFRGHENSVWSVAFSPDGKRIVSGSDDNTIGLWDLEGNQIVEPFRGHENSVWSVAFSPDGTRIVSGSDDNTIRLWDLEGNQIVEPFRGHENSVWSVAFSPDGKRIVSGSSDNTIGLWDLEGN
ncbi:MAG: caspase family protein [Hormoscilla sp.]